MRVKESLVSENDIKTYYDPPPIPQRDFDWAAIDYSTYGGEPSDPVGFGKTKEEAIQDLLDQIAMSQETRIRW